MATQEILVKYKADVSDLTNQLKQVIERMDKLEAESKSSAKGVDVLTKSVDNLGKEFTEVPKDIPKATAAVKTFTKTATDETNKLRTAVSTVGKDIAAGIAAGFTVTAVAQFAKASIGAFIEAEQNAEKLRFAVVNIGGEGVKSFEALIEQSERLQASLNISDDSIQQAQAALISFGLSAAQVEEVIPALADFAKLTGQDIPSAAQALGQAIQGRAGEFKKFGVDVSEANTEAENLVNIMEVMKTQAGAAAAATKTLAGQIEGAKIQVDEFQESLGGAIILYFKTFIDVIKPVIDSIIGSIKELFAVFKTGKSSVLEAADGLKILKVAIEVITFPVRVLFEAVNLVIEGITLLARTAKGTAAALVTAFNVIGETVRGVGQGIAEVFSGIASFDGSQITAGIQQIKTPVTNAAKEIADAFNAAFKIDISEEVEKQTDAAIKSTDKLLTRLELQKKGTQELIDLQNKYAKDNTVNGRSNLKLIEEEIAARKKGADAIEEQRKKLAELKAAIDNNFKAPIIVKADLKFQGGETDLAVNKGLEVELKEPDTTEFNNGIQAAFDKTVAGWITANQEILNDAATLLSDLNNLFDQFAEQRIIRIEKDLDTQLKAFDAAEEANQESLDKRRISEKDFAQTQKEIAENRARAEKEAERKINEIKKKQFNLDKIAALAEIIIQTAIKVVEAPLPLKPYYAAFGALQAGIVAAQPNPYKKGTKSAKKGLALVDEEGTEAILRGNGRLTTLERGDKVLTARKTKTYGEVLDAMMDNRFEKYVMQKYVAPQLERQRKLSVAKKENDFAENITRSMVINNMGSGKGDFFLERMAKQGIIIRNVEDFRDNTRISHKRK